MPTRKANDNRSVFRLKRDHIRPRIVADFISPTRRISKSSQIAETLKRETAGNYVTLHARTVLAKNLARQIALLEAQDRLRQHATHRQLLSGKQIADVSGTRIHSVQLMMRTTKTFAWRNMNLVNAY